MDSEIAHHPCPLCGRRIKVSDTEWTCPVCNSVNRQWNHMMNCEWCHFGPRFLECPFCGDEFDMWLIGGSYVDADGQKTEGNGRKTERPAVFHYRLGDLPSKLTGQVAADANAMPTPEVWSLFQRVAIGFPYPVGSWVIHTLFRSPDGRLWCHAWLFSEGPPPEGGEPAGQIAVVCPGRSWGIDRDYSSAECVLCECWF